MKRRHPEDDLQRAVAQLLDSLGWLWWHTPNGGRRSKIEAKRLKGLGVKPGVPDILILEPWTCLTCRDDPPEPKCPVCRDRTTGFGVAIELKAKKRKPTHEQKIVLAELQRRGFLCSVCRSIGEVVTVIGNVRAFNGNGIA